MDKTEIHYVNYDPDELFTAMQYAFIGAGGDVLYPGDEKEILLRAVQACIVQALGSVDNALRMATLRYAEGEYLDLYGEKRSCYRLEATKAKAAVEIRFKATGNAGAIAAGTALTADGQKMYLLDEAVSYTGIAQSVTANVTAAEAGSGGNGLGFGAQMQLAVPNGAVESIYCTETASGGQEREGDEAYRERIRTFGLANITTGPRVQYETIAKSVSSDILDARAVNMGAGMVGVSVLLQADTGAEQILTQVENALSADDVRPLTDEVSVFQAEKIPYKLVLLYKTPEGTSISAAVTAAIAEYQKWQDNKIGRAFNPDRLMAAIYQAGAERVIWGSGSNFNGGAVTYTEIDATKHCGGTITQGVIT